MTPTRNLVRHNPADGVFGDCHRACIAAILDIAPEEVPHFCQIEFDGGPSWVTTLREWLGRFGLSYACTLYPAEVTMRDLLETTAHHSRGVPMILGGAATIAPDCGHSVIIQDGEIVMDPSGSGICGPLPQDGFWRIEVITVGPAWGGRARLVELAA